MKDDTSKSPTEETGFKRFVTYRLARLQSRLNAQAIRLLRLHSKLSLTEWRIIGMTAIHGEATLSLLARETELDKGQLSRAVTTLVKKGYLRSKVNDADQRQNFLSLTDAGRAQHEQVLPVMRNRQAGLTETITEEEMKVLVRVIEKLEQAAEQPAT